MLVLPNHLQQPKYVVDSALPWGGRRILGGSNAMALLPLSVASAQGNGFSGHTTLR